jgi:hypothetical protein
MHVNAAAQFLSITTIPEIPGGLRYAPEIRKELL